MAANCHAGIEDKMHQGGFPAMTFDYAADSVTRDDKTGGWSDQGLAFIKDASTGHGGKLWYACSLGYDGKYVSSSWHLT